jgi:hypothetical protein
VTAGDGHSRILKGVMFNVRSLRNKMRTLECMCKDLTYDVIAITETWFCHENLPLLNPLTKFYQFASFERAHRGGGGVLLLVRKGITVRHLPDMAGACECAWVELVCKGVNVRIGVFYRAPDAGLEEFEAIESVMSDGVTAFPGTSVVLGDFNLPGIVWFGDDDNVIGSNAMERRFVALCDQLSLEQVVSEPTHDGGNILDLVLCDRVAAITKVDVAGKFHERCDHSMVEFSLACGESADERLDCGFASRPNFAKWDPSVASDMLRANPAAVTDCVNADEVWGGGL